MTSKIAFVLASADHAPMIVNRLDFKALGGGQVCGVGAMLLEKGSHEAGEIDLVLRLLERRKGPVVVVDAGANIGTHAIAWARAMTGWGEVIAVEAQERIFYALAGNIALNNCFNARAIWAALGNVSGAVKVPMLDHQRPANFGGLSIKNGVDQAPGQPVDFTIGAVTPALRLDDLALTRLDLLKIDVEGMEPEVLQGACETIKRLRPAVLVEVNVCGREAVEARLPGYRFQGAGMNVLAMHADDPTWGCISA